MLLIDLDDVLNLYLLNPLHVCKMSFTKKHAEED